MYHKAQICAILCPISPHLKYLPSDMSRRSLGILKSVKNGA